VEIHVGGLAGRRDQQLLPVDAVAQVEQLALIADAGDGVGPFQPVLLAQDVELLQLLIDVELLLDLALFLRDAGQAFGAFPAVGLGRGKPQLGAAHRLLGAPHQAGAGGDQRQRGEARQQQLPELFARQGHGSLRASVTVKRGASGRPTPQLKLSSSIWGNCSSTRETCTKACSGDALRSAMRRNSTTATFRFSVEVWVTGKPAVMRSYCAAARRASRCWLAARPCTCSASTHCTPAYSAQAAKPSAPAATMPRCSCHT